MATPFLGEIKLISWNYPPKGWAFCNGQTMQINQNQALFSLFGTTFGGDGRTTFGLPDLRGRVAQHFGDGYTLGQVGGEVAHLLKVSEMPTHPHLAQATNTVGNSNTAAGMVFADPSLNAYAPPGALTSINPETVSQVGGGQPHENMSPYLVVNFIVALQGIFPSRN